ncbi:MAG: HupE/UreJ family protein [Actinomycetota bacterium]
MKRIARVLVLSVTACALLVSLASPASAHRSDESYLYLDIGKTSLSGRVEMPYGDLRNVFGLSLEGTVEEIRAELTENLTPIQEYAKAKTRIGAQGEEWELTFDGLSLLAEAGVGVDGAGHAIFPFTVDLPLPTVPQLLETEFTPFLEEFADRSNIVLVANDWKREVVNEESNELLVVNADRPGGEIDLGSPNQWRNFTSSVELGLDHIKTGPDHIFFILVLLLTSVLVLQNLTWKPSPSFTYSFGRVVIVATMFTIAHSITFTLAGLDLIPLPPSKFTETLIAVSIGAAALHNLRPVLGHREWALAFAFGLFHGMGFAGLVSDLDIGRRSQLVSLLGRNVGIEIGQLIIIAIVFPGLFLLRRTRYYTMLLHFFSVALAVVSLVWVFERVFEFDAGINDTIDVLVDWPRSFFGAVIFTVIAGAAYKREEATGSLLEVGTPPSTSADVASDDVPQHV